MINFEGNIKPLAGGLVVITFLLLFTWSFTKKDYVAEIDSTESKSNVTMDEASQTLSGAKSATSMVLTNKNQHESLNADALDKLGWPEDYEIDTTKVDRANEVLQNISKLAESNAWEELIRLSHDILAENINLGSLIFLEAAKHDAPTNVFITLSNLGIKLPENASEFLIGTSDISTLQTLVGDYGLDLNHSDEIKGNAFSFAVTSDAPIEVYEFLIKHEAKLDDFGRFDPVQELISQAIIPGEKNEIRKITTLLKYGAVLTQHHYDEALKYKNYRPSLFTLIDNYYSKKQI